ncbi:MAG: translation initiation factor IF-2 [Lachnospiraceae bacterium]|jgi:translation initiation factor IF-2|nr:translation initiation factor IF-2 [Lachnospiraceae bacterium]
MAKMKVHELAKELDRKSKELIDFLQAKGYEVKVAQSSIEDDAIALVRKEFSSSGDKAAKAVGEEKQSIAEEKPRSEEPSVKEKTAPAAGGEKAAPAKSAPERPAAESEKRDGKGEAPKKKRIIFVSNPHNSKMGGRQSQGGGNGQGGQNSQNRGGNRPMSNGARPVQPQNTPHKIIRPTQKPIPVTAEPYDVRQKQQQERRLEQRQQEKRQQEKRQQEKWQQEKRDNNKNTAAGNKPAPGQGRVESAGENRRPEGQSRPNYSGGQGDRSRGGAPNAYGRNAGGGDRPQRGNGGPDNRFKKNNGPKDFVAEAPAKDAEKHRDDEKRRVNQDRDKRSKKDHIYEEDDAAVKNRNKAGRFIKPEKKAEASKEEQIKVITVPDTLTIKELADKMKIQPSAIIKKLFLQGQIVTLNSDISFEEAENIAIEYEIICEKEVKVDVIEELLREEEEDASTMVARPPVICVMGHVDHGKTSLLDAIRKTNVTDKEAGGITQAIGAYTVSVKGQSITFLDTPGHEAFTAMRMRGANSTDIAVLVVAADDGVMPQTVEAINHAKAAGIEIIVAVNKIDKPNANIDRVKQEMTEYELIPVDWGGSTEFVPVSAKSGEGIENLLETILLTAEILELKANPDRNARGLVIEAELDKGRGPVATVLVQKGTLHVGDFISAGASHGKVRAMIDDKGRRVREAKPSTPVEILGLSDVPSAGEVFIVHENDKSAKSYAETYMAQHKEEMLADTKTKMSLDDLFNQIQEGNLKELNLIVKADVQGSVEAVKQSLMKLTNEEVVVKCIHGGVGAINESDVSLASASSAIIIGFNVRPDAQAKTVAEREGVDVRLYKVIYQAIEDIEAAMKGMLDPVFEEKIIGHAEVRQIFKASAIGNIAGSYVLDGEFQRGCKIRIRRGEEQIYEGELASLKRFKDDVKEVKAGFECGLVFEGFDKMEELDIVEAYIMVEVPR